MTAVLKLPVPATEDIHVLVWPLWTDAGVQLTVTEVIVGAGTAGVGVGVLFEVIEPPPQPANRIVAPNATYFSTVNLPR